MKFHPLSSQVNGNGKAIFWALLTQTIWLPMFVAGSQEEWIGKDSQVNPLSGLDTMQKQTVKDQFNSTAKTFGSGTRQFQSYTQISKQNTGIVLNSLFLNRPTPTPASTKDYTTSNRSAYTSLVNGPATFIGSDRSTASLPNQTSIATNATRSELYSPAGLMQRIYSRSELLGGTLTLQDLNEPVMPPLARAERAQWSRSGDPLASLPPIWREPMRRALSSLTQTVKSTKAETFGRSIETINLDPARFVHVLSTRIRRASEVPLALQADGSVDILNQPDDPAVIDEINRWSARQTLPSKGSLTPAVVHLHPMEPLEVGQTGSRKTDDQSIETSKLRTLQSVSPLQRNKEPTPISATATADTQPAVSGRASGVDLSTAPSNSATPINSAAPTSAAAPISSGAAPQPVGDIAPSPSSEAES